MECGSRRNPGCRSQANTGCPLMLYTPRDRAGAERRRLAIHEHHALQAQPDHVFRQGHLGREADWRLPRLAEGLVPINLNPQQQPSTTAPKPLNPKLNLTPCPPSVVKFAKQCSLLSGFLSLVVLCPPSVVTFAKQCSLLSDFFIVVNK